MTRIDFLRLAINRKLRRALTWLVMTVHRIDDKNRNTMMKHINRDKISAGHFKRLMAVNRVLWATIGAIDTARDKLKASSASICRKLIA